MKSDKGVNKKQNKKKHKKLIQIQVIHIKLKWKLTYKCIYIVNVLFYVSKPIHVHQNDKKDDDNNLILISKMIKEGE